MSSEPIPQQKPITGGPLCPYCGSAVTGETSRCPACRGLLDPLSKQATQNSMGPWFVRDEMQPFRPGCNYGTVLTLVQRGKIQPQTIMRGPTTGQFWRQARQVPGVGHLFGRCHACDHGVAPDVPACPRCGASFSAPRDRQDLGLGPIQQLPHMTQRRNLATALSGTPQGAVAGAAPAPSVAGLGNARIIRGPAPTPLRSVGASSVDRLRVSSSASRLRQAGESPQSYNAGSEKAVPTDETKTRKRSQTVLVLTLTAASLVIALAVVAATVFSQEIASLFGAEEHVPTSTESRSEPHTPQIGG